MVLITSLSFHSMYPMVAQGPNAGLYSDPKLNFDKIELGLEAADYITESLKIATMGSESKNKLGLIYTLSALNKVFMTCNEFWKLNWLRFFYNLFNPDQLVPQGENYFAWIIARVICALIEEGKNGNIDTLGAFKFLSGIGYSTINTIPIINIENIVKQNKNNPLQKLKQEKLIQFYWLSLNKFLPIVIYTITTLLNRRAGFGWHLFQTIGDEESKKHSSIYRYCSLAACISELLRTYRQANYTKIFPEEIKTAPASSIKSNSTETQVDRTLPDLPLNPMSPFIPKIS